MTSRVSLTELAAAGIRLRPAEAATLVSEICRQYAAGTLRGIPSAGVIRITRDGEVVAEGPMTTNQDAVRCTAHLLNVLVGGFDAPPEYRASGALQIIIARALGTLDLPRYESLDAFCAALGRFATLDVSDAARDLFTDWIRTRMPRAAIAAPLTISDVRRARRATGLTLQHIAAVAGVPAVRLRDLEWGDMRQWRADAEGRAHVTRYARAAGLDDQVVLSIAWPMIEEAFASADGETAPVTALVPSGPQQLAPAPRSSPRATPWLSRQGWAAAAAALVLAMLAMFAMTGMRPSEAATPRPERAPVVTSDRTPVAIERTPVALERTPVAATRLVAPSQPEPAPRAARPTVHRKSSGKRPAARRTSFLDKELFRIEIR